MHLAAVEGWAGTPSWLSVFFAPKGRIDRLQFWVATIVTVFAENAVDFVFEAFDEKAADIPWPVMLACAVGALPSLYCGLIGFVKRLHDRDRSGFWCLAGLVPVFGLLWLLVETGFRPGLRGPNRFGPDPGRGAGRSTV